MTAREDALRRPLPDRVPWEIVGPDFFAAWGFPSGRFMPEHLSIYGPTGSGKSFFLKTILTERARLFGSHIVIICTKPADETISSMGWPVVDHWPPSKGWGDRRRTDQVIFWPRGGLGDAAKARQSAAIADLLHQLWKPQSNIIVVFDEEAYVEQELGLSSTVDTYYREGRALGITVVGSTQRPANVSRFMHSETSWSAFFPPKDTQDAERIAEVAGNKLYYVRVLKELDRESHEFLLVHNLTNQSVITSITPGHRIRVASTRLPSEPKAHVDHSVQ